MNSTQRKISLAAVLCALAACSPPANNQTDAGNPTDVSTTGDSTPSGPSIVGTWQKDTVGSNYTARNRLVFTGSSSSGMVTATLHREDTRSNCTEDDPETGTYTVSGTMVTVMFTSGTSVVTGPSCADAHAQRDLTSSDLATDSAFYTFPVTLTDTMLTFNDPAAVNPSVYMRVQ